MAGWSHEHRPAVYFGLGTHVQAWSGSFGLFPPSMEFPTVPVGDAMNAMFCAAQVRSQPAALSFDVLTPNANRPIPVVTKAAMTRIDWVSVIGVSALLGRGCRRVIGILPDRAGVGLCGLTFEVRRDQWWGARPGPQTMYTVPVARAWCPAVGPRLDRRVRPHCGLRTRRSVRGGTWLSSLSISGTSGSRCSMRLLGASTIRTAIGSADKFC